MVIMSANNGINKVDIRHWLMGITEFLHDLIVNLNLHQPPLAMIFLIFVSVFITYLSAWLTKLFVNQEEMKRINKILMDHEEFKKEVRETQNPKLYVKLKYNETRIQEINQRMAMKRIVPQLMITIPFFIIFGFLRGVMGNPALNLTPDRGGIVSVMPFGVPSSFPLIGGWFSQYMFLPELSAAGFGSMYFLSAVVTSTLLLRIFGVNPRGDMMQQQNPLM